MPDAVKGAEYTFDHFVHVAQMAERAKMDAIFFADSASVQPVDLIEKGDPTAGMIYRVTRLEPMSLLPALAAVTKHIGLIATATTTYNEPYHIARRFGTLDLISKGRGGWNLVTSQTESEAQNFGFESHMEHDERYERAEEFVDVTNGLWDSWDYDAIIEDKAKAQYFDPKKVHVLNHKGKYFDVRGPLDILRSPQGRPVIAQAGASGPGKNLAARVADLVFSAQQTIDSSKAFYDELKATAVGFGRNPDDIKVMPGLAAIVGRTDEEANETREQLRSGITDDQALRSLYRIAGGLDLTKFPLDGPMPELPLTNAAQARQKILMDLAKREKLTLRQAARRFAENQAHNVVAGSPSTIADVMQEWFEKGAADGFCVMPPFYPRGVENITNLLIPELQRRGLFRTEYEGKTLRENLGVSVPRRQFS